MNPKVYTTSNCPKCKKLKDYLSKKQIEYQEQDMTEPQARAELAMNDVFAKSAPILRINEEYYKMNSLFDQNSLKKQKLDQIITEEENQSNEQK
ncbi:NrdH-redoxin [archaeon SCG-AAA382B04]|nr:NrdH-redoxin [archaeon SCG-AAA382B04]